MQRLHFRMWEWRRMPFDEKHYGYISQFTDGNGIFTESWWSNPPSSIDHVGSGYLKNRHPNVKNARHEAFVKRRFKEEMLQLSPSNANESTLLN